ncbi:MAG TPA: YbjN domain-containing protein [Pseudomonadales bacterium]
MRIPLAGAALTAALASSVTLFAPAASADELVDAADPARMISILRGLGHPAQLDTDEVGDPLIRSEVGGTRFAILFYGCDEARHDSCNFVLFRVGYDLADGLDLERINEWNATELVGRAFRDDVDDPWLELAWNLDGGVTARNFETTIACWEAAVARFEQHIRF